MQIENIISNGRWKQQLILNPKNHLPVFANDFQN